MSLFPRLRQTCRRDHRGPAGAGAVGQGPSASAGALGGHPPAGGAAGAPHGQDPRLVLNRLFLSGILAADPLQDEGRDGDPVTLLLIAFPAPDAREAAERVETASCEVEVPAPVAARHGGKLRACDAVFVTGQLSGGGGVIATQIHSGPPPDGALAL